MRVDLVSSATDGTTDGIRVVLSERNLRALLSKLSLPGSACTIYTDRVYVSAEPDDQHYQGRTPGMMHPATEAALLEED